jgi:hypothetical protein
MHETACARCFLELASLVVLPNLIAALLGMKPKASRIMLPSLVCIVTNRHPCNAKKIKERNLPIFFI